VTERRGVFDAMALYFACERSTDHDADDGLLIAIDVATKGMHPRTEHFERGHKAPLKKVLCRSR